MFSHLRDWESKEKNSKGHDTHCYKTVAGNSQRMGTDYYADNAGGRMSKENKVTDTFDKLKDSVNKIIGTVMVMQNIIKGLDTPCWLCTGCKKRDDHLGICGSFVLQGNK